MTISGLTLARCKRTDKILPGSPRRLILVALGFFQPVSGGFAVPGSSLPQGRNGGESAVAPCSLGLICGIGGFCSGPILGGVLTMAASAGGAVPAAALLTLFAAGMAPAAGARTVWDRAEPGGRKVLRGREIQIGPIGRHVATAISSVIFIALGVTFIVFEGSNLLSGVYAGLGAADLSLKLESQVRAWAASPIAGAVMGLLLVVAFALRLWRRRIRGWIRRPNG